MGLAKGLVQQSTSSEVASVALAVLHGLSIVPLVLLPIMQDVHLKLGIVLNCTLLLCLMAGSLVFHWMGIVKVCCPSPPPACPWLISSMQVVASTGPCLPQPCWSCQTDVSFGPVHTQQVLPKMLDTFLLALYASMVPVAYLQTSWLQHWVNVYHYGTLALFAWVSGRRAWRVAA